MVLLLVASAALGAWRYALHQWEAAQVALKEDRPLDARDRLKFCLRVWPRSPEVHLLAARAARLSGDLHGAEAHLNRCLQLQDGASEGVQLEFLLLRVQSGEVDNDNLLAALFELVENAHPESPLILETIARAYILRLRYKLAYACLSLWIDKYPQQAKPYFWRGWVLERLSNPKGASADYHLALERDPDHLQARLRVAEMLLEDKQAPEALPHLERLMRQAPDDPQVQARMGICLYLQGRSEEARRLMEGAVAHLPKDAALLVALANLDLQDGKAADAERKLRTVLAEDSADTESLFVLSSVLQFQGRTEEAAAVLTDYERKRAIVDRINDLLKDKADSPTATPNDYAELGRLFLQIDRKRFGVYWSERALEKDPANQVAHRALAEHYEQKGETQNAAIHRRQLRPLEAPKSDPGQRGPGQKRQ